MHGVRCEACHSPGAQHVANMEAGRFADKSIFNPKYLSADELSQEFCGACHRSVQDVMMMPDGGGGKNSVRFQPYRIFKSKCYTDDSRISCTACHNPHEAMRREPAFYDAKCTACHEVKAPRQSGAAAEKLTARRVVGAPASAAKTAPPCPVEAKNCVTCHMPKIELPAAHFKFTDHMIRVVRAHEPFPR